MMVRERTRSLVLHGRLHRKRHAEAESSPLATEQQCSKKELKELQDKLDKEREEFFRHDQMRIEQIKALVAQLDMLGVEPAVRLDDSSSPICQSSSMGSMRRSLDISFRKKYRSSLGLSESQISDIGSNDEDDEDEECEVARKTNGSQLFKGQLSSSMSSSSEEETSSSSGRDTVVMPSSKHVHQSSGSSCSCGSASETNSVSSVDGAPASRSSISPATSSLSICTRTESRGNNEALQLRLHEMESIMQEQDVQHQEEIDQLSQQLEDAKTLIAQYQSLLSESEVARHRVETAAGLRSAIAAKPSHIALSEGELRVMSQNEQVKGAVSSLLEALNASKAQNSGPTMHKVYDILHELNDDSLMIR